MFENEIKFYPIPFMVPIVNCVHTITLMCMYTKLNIYMLKGPEIAYRSVTPLIDHILIKRIVFIHRWREGPMNNVIMGIFITWVNIVGLFFLSIINDEMALAYYPIAIFYSLMCDVT